MTEVFQSGPREKKKKKKQESWTGKKKNIDPDGFPRSHHPEISHNIPHWEERENRDNIQAIDTHEKANHL